MSDSDIPKVTLNEVTQKLELEYPCLWVYKIIGTSEDAVRAAVLETVSGTAYTLELSNMSSKRTYVSLSLEVNVHDEAERIGIFEALRGHDAIRMVL